MEKSGYIYVLTNESFHRDNWIKIGYAEDVDKRVKELSGTAVPLPYEIYCTYEIPRIHGVKDPDKLLHDLITNLNPGLRISPNREFFEMLPWDAYDMLFAIAQMHGRTDKLKRNEANPSGQDAQNDSEYSVEALFPQRSAIRGLYEKLKNIILSIDPTLEEAPRLNYVAYKTGKRNTVSLWPKSNWIEVVLNPRRVHSPMLASQQTNDERSESRADTPQLAAGSFIAKLGQLNDDNGFIYDISNRKWSSEQYALKFFEDTDTEAARGLIKQVLDLKK